MSDVSPSPAGVHMLEDGAGAAEGGVPLTEPASAELTFGTGSCTRVSCDPKFACILSTFENLDPLIIIR